MNERLEQEFDRYIAEHKERVSGQTVTLNVKKMAQHFYNLALEDVKKEVLSEIGDASKLKDDDRRLSALGYLANVRNFINNQKQ